MRYRLIVPKAPQSRPGRYTDLDAGQLADLKGDDPRLDFGGRVIAGRRLFAAPGRIRRDRLAVQPHHATDLF